ncbi:MAG: zinc ribbon domain-containing protein [Chloroflexi bacterium]|nr:zinc ribbon domain-containing protein [Chloroflexota bacterium]
MPRYEFLCPSCDRTMVIARSFADADRPATCPACATEAVRQLSTPTVLSSRPRPATDSAPSAPRSGSWYHHGHSHGPGAGSHQH